MVYFPVVGCQLAVDDFMYPDCVGIAVRPYHPGFLMNAVG